MVKQKSGDDDALSVHFSGWVPGRKSGSGRSQASEHLLDCL